VHQKSHVKILLLPFTTNALRVITNKVVCSDTYSELVTPLTHLIGHNSRTIGGGETSKTYLHADFDNGDKITSCSFTENCHSNLTHP